MKYTEEEIEFLIENYPKYGGKYCQPFLKSRSIDAINATAGRLGLSAKNKVVHPSLQKIDVRQFENIISKEVAYFLGFFWADGNIITYTSNNITSWRIALEIQTGDANIIQDIIMSLGKWSIQTRKRGSWKETTTFVTNNKDLFIFLSENGYSSKSIDEPSKILKLIPDELKVYFWKGLIDGDGSIGLIGRGAYFELASTYDYNYTEFIDFIECLGVVKYNTYKSVSKKGHKSSVLKIYGKEILKLEPIFIEYGLQRKTDKFLIIKNKYKNENK